MTEATNINDRITSSAGNTGAAQLARLVKNYELQHGRLPDYERWRVFGDQPELFEESDAFFALVAEEQPAPFCLFSLFTIWFQERMNESSDLKYWAMLKEANNKHFARQWGIPAYMPGDQHIK